MSSSPSRLRTLDMAYIALFAVLMAVCAWITVPLPKPLVQFTMQTFAMFMALTTLGGRRGLYAMVVYLLLGAVGVPVFSGFRGGLGVLLDTTGGYIIGFVAAALLRDESKRPEAFEDLKAIQSKIRELCEHTDI